MWWVSHVNEALDWLTTIHHDLLEDVEYDTEDHHLLNRFKQRIDHIRSHVNGVHSGMTIKPM